MSSLSTSLQEEWVYLISREIYEKVAQPSLHTHSLLYLKYVSNSLCFGLGGKPVHYPP